jgi:hypothetical protein
MAADSLAAGAAPEPPAPPLRGAARYPGARRGVREVGSANLDPRSLRLNFEFNLECYDPSLTAELINLYESKRSRSREVTLAEVDKRNWALRLRDGTARLFTPLL